MLCTQLFHIQLKKMAGKNPDNIRLLWTRYQWQTDQFGAKTFISPSKTYTFSHHRCYLECVLEPKNRNEFVVRYGEIITVIL